MPRAEKLFTDFGVDVIPSATNYRLKGSWKKKRFGLPSITNIEMLNTALLSYAAMIDAKRRSRLGSGCD